MQRKIRFIRIELLFDDWTTVWSEVVDAHAPQLDTRPVQEIRLHFVDAMDGQPLYKYFEPTRKDKV